TVSVWVSRIGVRSWDLDYSIRGPRGVQYAVGRTTQVAYDYKTRSAANISGELTRELAKYVEAPVKFRETGEGQSFPSHLPLCQESYTQANAVTQLHSFLLRKFATRVVCMAVVSWLG